MANKKKQSKKPQKAKEGGAPPPKEKEEDEKKVKEEEFSLEGLSGRKNKDERVKCEVCEIDVLKSYLRRHMKRKHGNKEENPDVQDFGEE